MKECPKQRFNLEERNGKYYIRAVQGHSIKSIDDNKSMYEIKSLE